ncbi:MAG: PaaI family thioesterase [Candidatus Eremiobacteraeota bacterium]|nr:PaaI family thioesterase [Candidatus Eremiobacteraeota bacterium]
MADLRLDGNDAGVATPPNYPHAIDIFRRLDGLEALGMMQRGEVPVTNITRWMNFSLETVERGHVVFGMVPHEELYNLIGSVHGGIITTLMDNALGCSVQSLLPAGQVATTMDLHTRFHRPVTAATGKVFADARVVHAGRRTATSEAHLVDANGTVYATGTSTLMILVDQPNR